MVVGTNSSCGKSFVTSAILRYLNNKGISAAPFKAQNISLNSYITDENKEIAYSTYVQSLAARMPAKAIMNPVLIKPARDKTQIIVNGEVIYTGDYQNYDNYLERIKKNVQEAFFKLSKEYDVIVIEGAGSSAEINMDNDIANSFIAEIAKPYSILVGDIHWGGVFASLHGTLDFMPKSLKNSVKSFIINRYSGEKDILQKGIEVIEGKHNVNCLGVLPYDGKLKLPDEDFDFFINASKKEGSYEKSTVGILKTPYLSNSTDFYPLMEEDSIELRYLSEAAEIDSCGAIILPGSKNTEKDYIYLKNSGFIQKIREYAQKGGKVIGICGGYQMLGSKICDEAGVEMSLPEISTIGLMNHKTYFVERKVTRKVKARCDKILLDGFEIHNGISNSEDQTYIIEEDTNNVLGTINKEGNVWGTYIHNIFYNEEFRSSFIKLLEVAKSKEHKQEALKESKENDIYEKMALLLEENTNIDSIIKEL